MLTDGTTNTEVEYLTLSDLTPESHMRIRHFKRLASSENKQILREMRNSNLSIKIESRTYTGRMGAIIAIKDIYPDLTLMEAVYIIDTL